MPNKGIDRSALKRRTSLRRAPGAGAAGRLRLIFERPAGANIAKQPTYPKCEHVLSVLKTNYGSPAEVEELSEERARNRSAYPVLLSDDRKDLSRRGPDHPLGISIDRRCWANHEGDNSGLPCLSRARDRCIRRHEKGDVD